MRLILIGFIGIIIIQKAKDGFGMGVSVHSMPDLMKMHGISSNEAALDHKGLRHTCNKLSTKLTRENTKLLVHRRSTRAAPR